MNGVLDLFGAPTVPRVSMRDGITDLDEEAALIVRIDAKILSPFRCQGWLGKRLTRPFGWRDDFEDGSFYETNPHPDWRKPVGDYAATFAGLGARFFLILVNSD
ncbi:hypothetical protein WG907_06465 [Sphingobium sp. AN558]|uniref:hypothetical protein n=1 Tax=Sphingobium sp. AN558 TaxID=3133442 RepID=UPI0030BAF148